MIKGRLKEFLAYIKLSEGKFEADIGVSKGFVSNIKGGIGSTTLNKISAKYPQLSHEWLLTGKGKMIVGEKVSKPETYGDLINEYEATINELREQIKMQKKYIAVLEEKLGIK